MIVEVWTGYVGGLVGPKRIWRGEMTAVPREGEYICVRDGYGAEVVMSVMYDVVNNEIELRVGPDDENVYPEV